MKDVRGRLSHPVLCVAHIASGDLWGGAEAQLYSLAKELNRSSAISLYVILLNHGILEQRLRDCGVEVIVVDETKFSSVQVLFRLYRILADIRPNILHTHRQKENVLGSLAMLFLGNCKSLRTVHGQAEFSLRLWQVHKRFYRLLDWFCGRVLQDRIVAVSEELGILLARQFTPQKVGVVYNGVDVDEVINRSRLQISLPGSAEAFKVAFVGRLVPVKRVDVFIDIAKELLSEDKDRYRFYVFGEGPLQKELDAQIRAANIGCYIYRMGFTEDLAAYLVRMNTLVITSNHEGLPISLLEALVLGVPVLAHAVGGIPELLNDGKYGELVSTQHPMDYAKKIRALAEDRGRARRKTNDGCARVVELCSARHGAENYMKIYRSLLS